MAPFSLPSSGVSTKPRAIHPHAAGGQTTIDNLQLLCGPCHTHHHRNDDHNRTGQPKQHDRSKQPPAWPPDRPTGNHLTPVTADTATNTPTTRGP